MSRPAAGTPENALWVAAIQIAASAPVKRSPTSVNASVSWSAVDDLRSALDALGIDWRAVREKARAAR